MSTKRLLWLMTGGTFSCPPADRGLSPLASVTQARRMLSHCGISDDIDVEVTMNKDSSDICPDDWELIAAKIDANIRGYDGVIITHGTDTLGYTAAALYYMLRYPPIPIVLTGSQMPFFAENSDAPQNLKAAVNLAKSGINGVMAAFGGRKFYGCDIYKADSVSYDAFRSRRGELDENAPPISGEYRPCLTLRKDVAVIKVTPALIPEMMDMLCGGISAAVLECYGCGGVPEILLPSIRRAARRGVRLIAVSECVGGEIDLNRYAVGEAAQDCGISGGGNIGVAEAVARLMTNF